MSFFMKICIAIFIIGVLGMMIGANLIARVSIAQRLGLKSYPEEQRKKKRKWVAIFFAVSMVGVLMLFLYSWATGKPINEAIVYIWEFLNNYIL